MRKFYIIFSFIFVLAAIFILWILFTFVFDKKVNETFLQITEAHKDDPRATFPENIARGEFYGSDKHFAKGSMRIIKFGDYYYLRFEDDFQVIRSPDSYIYLGSDSYYDESSRVAQLKGNIGSQNYLIPVDISPLEYNHIWIWSKSLEDVLGGALFDFEGSAKLPEHDSRKSQLDENAG